MFYHFMLLCLISSLLSTQRFSKSGPHSACSSHIGWLIKCVSAGSLRIPAPAEFLKGLALESVLLKTRCSASVNDKYILLLAIFLVKNNLFLQLFWLLGFKKKKLQQHDTVAVRERASTRVTGADANPEAADPGRWLPSALQRGV